MINFNDIKKSVAAAEITPDHRAQIMGRVKRLRTHLAIVAAYDNGTLDKVLPLAHKVGSIPEDYSGTSRQNHVEACEDLQSKIEDLLVTAKAAYNRVRGAF